MECVHVLTKTHKAIFCDAIVELKFKGEISNGNILHFLICYIFFSLNIINKGLSSQISPLIKDLIQNLNSNLNLNQNFKL